MLPTMDDQNQNQNQNSAAQWEKLVIQNSHGQKLQGLLHETGSQELVVVCHGFRSSKDRIPMINIATAFEREGISAFRFDFTGNGESEGSFQYGNYGSEAEDLLSVVQHFHREKRIVVALIGHSKGGNAVILYASRYHDVQVIVNISGRFNLEKGMEGRLGKDFMAKIEQDGFIDVNSRKGYYRVTKESLMDRLTTDTHGACLKIDKNCRVITIHGSMDEIVPVDDALAFFKYINHSRLHIIEGADHEYTSHQNELCSVVSDFVLDNLPAYKSVRQLINSRF